MNAKVDAVMSRVGLALWIALVGLATPLEAMQGEVSPIARPDIAATDSTSVVVIDVLANDEDPDGSALTVTAAPNQCSGLVAAQPDGRLIFVPSAGSIGTCSLTYTLHDGSHSASSTVTLQVSPGTGAPAGVGGIPTLRPDLDPHRFFIGDQPMLMAGYYPGIQALLVKQPGFGLHHQYRSLLTQMESHDLNLLRVVLTMGMAYRSHDWLHPYEQTNECCVYESNFDHVPDFNKFDVNTFNDDYFDYWDAVITDAAVKGIVVQTALIDGFHSRVFHESQAEAAPLENFGLAFSYYRNTNSNIGDGIEHAPQDFYRKQEVVEKQEALVIKSVEELCHHQNVIWEIANEAVVSEGNHQPAGFGGRTWFEVMEDAIRQTEQAKGCQPHLIMHLDSPDHRELAGHWTPSGGLRPDDPFSADDPSVDDEDEEYLGVYEGLVHSFFNDYPDQPLIADNDCCYLPGTPELLRKKAWLSLVAGANPSMLVFDVPQLGLGSPTVSQGMKAVGLTRRLVEKFDIDLLGMEPRGDLITQNAGDYVWPLARAGEQYIVYLYNGGTVTFAGGALPVDYEAHWFDPRSGASEAISPLPANGSFSKPSGEDWVLFVRGDQVVVVGDITIDPQPASLIRQVGQTAVFNIGATIDPVQGLTFHWTKNGADLPLDSRYQVSSTATSSSLTINNLESGDAGNYRCQVTAAAGETETSNTAALTVTQPDPEEPRVTDHLSLNGSDRVLGSLLHGTVTDSGERAWEAGPMAIFGGDSTDGEVTHGDAGSQTQSVRGSFSFDPLQLPGTPVLTLGSDLRVSGAGWAGLGFASSATAGFAGTGGSGQVWILIRQDGEFGVHVEGSGNHSPLAAGTATDFVVGGDNKVKVQYDTVQQTVSAWVNSQQVLSAAPLPGDFGNRIDITHAGFHLNLLDGGAAGRMVVDDVFALAGTASGEVNGVQIDSDNLPTALGCGSQFVANVTVTNTGNTAWARFGPLGGYKWGHIGPDPFTTAPRIWLLPGKTILPGEAHTWAWVMTAPSVASTYNTTWQMIREETGWFGDTVGRDILVSCDNLPPVAVDDPFSGDLVTGFEFTAEDLMANDFDPDSGDTVSWGNQFSIPTEGSIEIVQVLPSIRYEYLPGPNHPGTDSFTYRIVDDHGAEAFGTVLVTLNEANGLPECGSFGFDTPVDTPHSFTTVDMLATASDPDGDVVSVVFGSLTDGDHGTVLWTGSNGTTHSYRYTPDSGYSGPDAFDYVISDGTDTQACTASVQVIVTNQPPVCGTDSLNTREDTPVSFTNLFLLANDSDPDGDPIEVVSGSPTDGLHGVVTHDGSSGGTDTYSYTPHGGYVGADSFSYSLFDGTVNSTCTVNVQVDANLPPAPADDFFQVPTGATTVSLLYSKILANDTDPEGDPLTVTAVGSAAYGTVSNFGAAALFYPSAEFWTVGSDAFTYQVSGAGMSATGIVHLRAQKACDSWFSDGFESGDLSAWDVTDTGGGALSVQSSAALEGTYGLEAAASSGVVAWVRDQSPQQERHYRARFLLDPAALTMAEGDSFRLARGYGSPGSAFTVFLRREAGQYQIAAVPRTDGGSWVFSPFADLQAGAQVIELEWWAASGPGLDDGGAQVWVDHHLAAEVGGIDNDQLWVDWSAWGLEGSVDAGTSGALKLDSCGACGGEGSRQPLGVDGFESGDLSGWDGTVASGSGGLMAHPKAALNGSYGLQVTVDSGTQSLWVEDDSPQDETHYWARFRFDPNTLGMAVGDTFPIGLGRDIVSGGAAFTLQLNRTTNLSSYNLGLWVKTRDGGNVFAPYALVSDGPHELLLEWWAASDPTTADGGGRLWVDSTLVAELSGVQNHGRRIDQIRLGALWGIDANTSGEFYLDDFESWRGRRSADYRLRDDFESGGLGAWDAVQTTGGTVTVAPAPPANGSAYHLQVDIQAGAQQVRVLDVFPNPDRHYGAEVRFDPDSLPMTVGDHYTLLQGLGPAGSALTLHLRQQAGGYELSLWALNTDGAWVFGPWTPIADQEQTLRIEWLAATAPGVDDGLAQLWSGDTLLHSLSALANAGKSIDKILLGAVSGMDPGTLGTITFDDYRSWR
ncbi:MAG: tandem-95 repeat protein [Deltaproteobacteria bacterium]|nr:tandem-95 repeat protein [Deltaproteobacteria bacterium]